MTDLVDPLPSSCLLSSSPPLSSSPFISSPPLLLSSSPHLLLSSSPPLSSPPLPFFPLLLSSSPLLSLPVIISGLVVHGPWPWPCPPWVIYHGPGGEPPGLQAPVSPCNRLFVAPSKQVSDQQKSIKAWWAFLSLLGSGH
ncbi:unnamed protein product [Pleuronectes platessa]|uniref:Uncharacterized protein n=1 Tax=Pleuronectes platessa TaxID=8262 RepID=A0A9N7Z278_PLEPL|nr:unnamed protein product [Pleuronectes platessa]